MTELKPAVVGLKKLVPPFYANDLFTVTTVIILRSIKLKMSKKLNKMIPK